MALLPYNLEFGTDSAGIVRIYCTCSFPKAGDKPHCYRCSGESHGQILGLWCAGWFDWHAFGTRLALRLEARGNVVSLLNKNIDFVMSILFILMQDLIVERACVLWWIDEWWCSRYEQTEGWRWRFVHCPSTFDVGWFYWVHTFHLFDCEMWSNDIKAMLCYWCDLHVKDLESRLYGDKMQMCYCCSTSYWFPFYSCDEVREWQWLLEGDTKIVKFSDHFHFFIPVEEFV